MPRYSEAEAREAVASASSYSEALRALGLRPAGGNHRLFRRYVDVVWGISTAHFPPMGSGFRGPHREAKPLVDVLVEGSTYERSSLKRRLYDEGLKERACELCGQGEEWRGARMGLILDHVNGVPDDNRLDNLRIVCPNCNATLDTHCGRHNRRGRPDRACAVCGRQFTPKSRDQSHCGRFCGTRHLVGRTRRVERPPFNQLMQELKETGYEAVGRVYGVSGNAIRKWVRAYEAEARASATNSKDRRSP